MKDFVRSEKGKMLYWLIGSIVAVIFAFVLLPPLYVTWNKLDPTILGFPFLVAVSFIFMMILSICLVLLYQIQKVRGEL